MRKILGYLLIAPLALGLLIYIVVALIATWEVLIPIAVVFTMFIFGVKFLTENPEEDQLLIEDAKEFIKELNLKKGNKNK